MRPEPNEPTSRRTPPTKDSAPNERDDHDLIRGVAKRADEQREWLFQSFREMEKTVGRSLG